MPTPAPSGNLLVLDRIARFVLILGFSLVPFFAIPAVWAALPQSKMLLLSGVAGIAVLLWALARLFEGTVRVPRGALLYAGLLLVVAYIVSAAVAGWPMSALVGQGIEQDTLAAVIIFYVLFALTTLLFAGHHGMRAAIRAFAVSTTVLLAFQAVYIFLPQIGFGILTGQTANLLGSWHDLGILAGLALFLSVAFFHSSVFNGAWRILLFALGTLAFFMLIIVHFSDILWGTAALLTLGLLAAMRSSLRTEGIALKAALIRSWVPFTLATVLSLAAAFGPVLWDKLPAPLLVSQVEVRPSWQGTFDVGKQSIGAPVSLLFGTGPNSFIREWGVHKPEGVNETPFWNSDFNYGVGIIPTSVFTAGLVGTFAWLALVVIVLGLIVRFAYEARPLTSGRITFGFLLAGVAYLVVFHMIYTPGPALTGITFTLLGFLAVIAAGDRPPRILSTERVLSAVVFAVVVLAAVPVVFATVFIGREIISNLFVNRAATTYAASGNIADASALLSTSLTLSPRNDRAHRAAAELGFVEFSQLAAGGATTNQAREQLQSTLQETVRHGLAAVDIDAENYLNWLSLAQVYGSLAGVNVNGAYEEAKLAYERAFAANPGNPAPKLRLAQLAAARNDLSGARTYLQEALALKQDFAAAYYLLSQIESVEGKNEAATQAAASAVQLVPDDPLGWFNLGYILYSGGVYTDAAASFEQAVTRAPDYSNALFFLALSYDQIQRPDDAILVLQRVIELNPSETWIQQGIENIRAGTTPFPDQK